MIDLVTGWFEILKYNVKRTISISNLVESTCLTRCPIPMEIRYNQRSDFICHEIRKFLIEKRIRDKIQAKQFRKSNFQCDIGTNSPDSRKPSVDFNY